MINSDPIVTAGRFELQVCRYRLWLSIGWTHAERQALQPIDIDVSITPVASPVALQTDSLADTFCYATLLEKISQKAKSKSFSLLEHLAKTLFDTTEQFLLDQGYRAAILVGVTKVCPPVPGVLGGIRVLYHNTQQSVGTPCLTQ
jgi:dihydroneopterin aldolase